MLSPVFPKEYIGAIMAALMARVTLNASLLFRALFSPIVLEKREGTLHSTS